MPLALSTVPTSELFERDPGRYERFSREAVGLLLDFSRQRIDEVVLAKLAADGTRMPASLEQHAAPRKARQREWVIEPPAVVEQPHSD